MSHHQESSTSDSENSDYYSADEAGPDIDMQETDQMDWETSRTTVSVTCRVNNKEPTSNLLLCTNAAPFMTRVQSARTLKSLLTTGTLYQIVMLSSTGFESAETCELLDLPLFSSKFTYETSTLPNIVERIHSQIHTLHELGAVAIVEAGIHCITVSAVAGRQRQGGNAVVIFAPPVKSSISNEAAFHLFPSIAEASIYINELFQPLQEVTAHIMLPKPIFISSHEAILPVYEGNIRLLERTMKLSDMNSDVQGYQRNIATMQRSLVAERNKTQDAINAANSIQRDITEIQEKINEVQNRTNAMLYEQSQQAWSEWEYAESTGGSSTNESRTKPKTWGLSWKAPMKFLAGPSTEKSSKPTSRSRSRSNSYNSPFADSSGSSGQDDRRFEEALRLQAQFSMEDDPSYQLAKRMEEEDLARIAAFEALQRVEKENAPFDCPICADTYPRGNLVKVESCGQGCAICRGCLLQHIKAQVEQARWPIFCPICPNTAPQRGVVSRWMAEIVGADDAVFAQWNRMELANFSIAVECPKCKISTPVDAEDFRAATALDCPLQCGAHWCKNCHRQIARGGVHSCDGEAEFREMVKQQSATFKPCPKCNTMIEKSGGCDHMVCTAPGCATRFNWSSAGRR